MGPPGFWRTRMGLLSVGMLPLLAPATRIPTCRIHANRPGYKLNNLLPNTKNI